MSKLKLNPNAPAFLPRTSPSPEKPGKAPVAAPSTPSFKSAPISADTPNTPHYYTPKTAFSPPSAKNTSSAVPIRSHASSTPLKSSHHAGNPLTVVSVSPDAEPRNVREDLRNSAFSRTPVKVNLNNFELIALIGDGMAGKVCSSNLVKRSLAPKNSLALLLPPFLGGNCR